MSKAKLHYLASTASDNFLDDGIPLDESITKIAKEHALNSDQLARVCELANLKTFDAKVKQASSNTVSFELADATKVAKKLNLTEAPKAKTAAAFEYKISPSFLGNLVKEASDVATNKLTKKLAEQDMPYKEAKQLKTAIEEKLAARKKLQQLNGSKIGLQLKLASEHAEAVTMVKHAALDKTVNPFSAWPKINQQRPDLKEVTDSVFTKAAKDLTSTWRVKVEDLLEKAKKEAAKTLPKEHDAIGKDGTSIVHKLDTISAYQELYDKVQDSVLKTKGSTEINPAELDEVNVKKVINNTSKLKKGKIGR